MPDRGSERESGQIIVAQPDWWGRIMALGAIILAGAALLYSMGIKPDFLSKKMTSDAGSPTATDTMTTAADPGAANRQEMADARSSAPEESTLGADPAMKTGDPSSAGMLEPNQLAGADTDTAAGSEIADDTDMPVQDLFDKPADDKSIARTDVASEAAEDPADESPAEDDELLDLESLDKHPELQIVQTVLKPTGQQPTVTVTVKNTGSAAASITSAIFMPKQVVEVPREVSLGPLITSDESNLLIAFNPADNQATKEGKHADYARTVQDEFSVDPGQTIKVHVAIQDSQFVGYGFEGDLRLVFDDLEKLEVSGVTVAFVK